MNSSRFVPKRRKRYGCEMLALRAISSVDAPAKPCSAKTSSAASRTCSRRSSLDFRSVAVAIVRCKLSLTYNAVKRLGDTVELRVGQLGVQRQRERALEAFVRSGEAPLAPVRGQTVERVRADLALDALGAKIGHHAVAVVELDDVGLPAVAIAFVGGGQADRQVSEPLGVAGGNPLAGGEQLVEPPYLRDPDRAEDVGQAVVEGATDHVLVGIRRSP